MIEAPATGWLQWTIILALTAIVLSLVVVAQILTKYSAGYMNAPTEIATFLDTVDFSVQENEAYDRDIQNIPGREDKVRLDRILREIQKVGDDLREELEKLLLDETTTTLKMSARLLWAAKSAKLEGRVRRLDLLRMRFLVLHMSMVTHSPQQKTTPQKIHSGLSSPLSPPPPLPPPLPRDPKNVVPLTTPTKPPLKKSHTDGGPQQRKPPPLRRLATQAIGHSTNTGKPHKRGWLGVVEELRMSPIMQRRAASIEQAMAEEKAAQSA